VAHGRHAGDGAGAGGRHEEAKNVGGKIHAQHLCDLTVGETVYFPENRWLDVPCGYLGGGRSPTLGFAVFEEGHQLVQDLHELVDMGAGLRYQISTLFEGQVRRNRAVVAPEHQSVVEGLMVTQVRTRALAALPQLGGSEKCYLQVSGGLYNRCRLHSALNFRRPANYEEATTERVALA
jgi:hypothetical protein